MNKIFGKSWQRFIVVIMTVVLLTTPAITGFAAANVVGSPSKNSVPENNKDIDVLLEIVNSDLEEKAVINEDGTVSNYYSSAAKAGVSKEAFQEFESTLGYINKEVRAGNIKFGEGLFDAEVKEPEVTTKSMWCFTNSQVTQALKLIQAGAAVATVASFLGVPTWVAAGFFVLYAAGDLCNWCDMGFCIFNVGSLWWCTPIC